MAEKLRVGIIGCGNIALRHVAAFLDSGRYEVSALAEPGLDVEITATAVLD